MRVRSLFWPTLVMGALPSAPFDCSAPEAAAPPRSLQAQPRSLEHWIGGDCVADFPDEHAQVTALLEEGEEHGVVLLGWENCACTWYATNRFDAEELCYTRHTWADRNSDLMKYLQCIEGSASDHSFIYTKESGEWKFQGNGFAFMEGAMTQTTLDNMLTEADCKRECPTGSFDCTDDCFFDDISSVLAANAISPSYRYGVSIVDTDGDHRFEAVVCGYTGPNLVLAWEGEGFVDRAADLGMESNGLRSIGIGSCDVDGDVIEEVYVLNTGAYAGTANSQSDNLYKKTANGWEDLFARDENAGARNLFAGRSVACVDRFGNGRYSVAAASYGEQIHLYEVDDAGKISDVGPSVGFTGTPGGRGITAGPLAGRSTYTPETKGTDVFFVNENNPSYGADGCNFLFQAQSDGTFANVAADFDVQDCDRGGRGVAVVDADLDGRLDIVNGNWGHYHRLWVRDGDDKYKDVATAEMGEPSYIRTVIAADLDNDGHTELFWNNIDSYGRGAPNRLFKQNDDGTWTRATLGPAELPLGHGTGAAVADFDQDGRLELLISHGESASQPMSLFRARGSETNRFLRVLPLTPAGAPARGAIVTVTLEGGKTVVRNIDAGSGYLCQMEPVAHFGLGRGRATKVVVNFVDGKNIEFAPEINTMYAVGHDGTVDVVFSRPDAAVPETEATTPKPTPEPTEESSAPEQAAGESQSQGESLPDGQPEPTEPGFGFLPDAEATGSTPAPEEETSALTTAPTSDPVDEVVTSGGVLAVLAPVLAVGLTPSLI